MTTRLIELLPAVHRARDVERGGPLSELLELLDAELDVLRDNADDLYDAWFVETCEEWVVPYLGDLLGVRGLADARTSGRSRRAFVANTLAYRRRKGTVAVLEELARDVTGWPAKAVEFFSLLGWTQHLAHVRPTGGGTASLRSGSALELVDGPFDDFAHTADVRHIDNARGRHNIPHVGVFLWRLGSYPVQRARARRLAAGRFSFSPLGHQAPLFNRERPEREIAHLATESNVAGPLRRRALHDELRGANATALEDRYFAEVDPVIEVWVEGTRVPTAQLAICDLTDPARTAPSGSTAAVDPKLGLVALASGADVATAPFAAPPLVDVSYSYGFPGELGGGPYDRQRSIAAEVEQADDERRVGWQRGVSRTTGPTRPKVLGTLAAALGEWHSTLRPGPVGLIALMDSRTHEGGPWEIEVPRNRTLVLTAGDWPSDSKDAVGNEVRRDGRLEASGVRPHVRGDVVIRGPRTAGAGAPGALVLDGLLIEGTVTIQTGALGRVRVAHCTVADTGGPAGIVIERDPQAPSSPVPLDVLALERSIAGPVEAGEHVSEVRVEEAILQGADALLASDLRARRSTLLGASHARTVHASDCLFLEPLVAERRQVGCVRYSYVAPGSRAPRRFRCLPGEVDDPGRLRPDFTSTTHGDPGFGQLSAATAPELLQAAEDGGQVGAFNFVGETHRMAELRVRIDEYLRFGLEAGAFFVT